MSITVFDQEANLFAERLLVPTLFLEREVKRLRGISHQDDKKLKTLAQKFQVTEGLIMKRLTEEKLLSEPISEDYK